ENCLDPSPILLGKDCRPLPLYQARLGVISERGVPGTNQSAFQLSLHPHLASHSSLTIPTQVKADRTQALASDDPSNGAANDVGLVWHYGHSTGSVSVGPITALPRLTSLRKLKVSSLDTGRLVFTLVPRDSAHHAGE